MIFILYYHRNVLVYLQSASKSLLFEQYRSILCQGNDWHLWPALLVMVNKVDSRTTDIGNNDLIYSELLSHLNT